MEKFNSHNEIFLKFYGLTNHRKVSYYEDFLQNKLGLTIDEKLELEIEYIFALFEIGKYDKVLAKIDKVIENVIFENFERHNNQDAYMALLFKKSASLFNIMEYDQCISITKQLISISPNVPLYRHLLSLANRKKKYLQLQSVNHYGVLVTLTSMALFILDIFILDPFFYNYHLRLIYLIDGLFIIGFGMILYQAIYFLRKKYA